jgi:hypothetical protein
MNLQRWIARREAKWQELDKLLQRAEQQGIKSLAAQEIGKLASLYRTDDRAGASSSNHSRL